MRANGANEGRDGGRWWAEEERRSGRRWRLPRISIGDAAILARLWLGILFRAGAGLSFCLLSIESRPIFACRCLDVVSEWPLPSVPRLRSKLRELVAALSLLALCVRTSLASCPQGAWPASAHIAPPAEPTFSSGSPASHQSLITPPIPPRISTVTAKHEPSALHTYLPPAAFPRAPPIPLGPAQGHNASPAALPTAYPHFYSFFHHMASRSLQPAALAANARASLVRGAWRDGPGGLQAAPASIHACLILAPRLATLSTVFPVLSFGISS